MVFKKVLAAGIACSLMATMSFSALGGLTTYGLTPKNGLDAKNLVGKDVSAIIEAEDYETLSGGKVMYDSAASNGTHLGDFAANCKAFYKINVADAGTYEIKLRVSSPQGGVATVSTQSIEADPVSFKQTGGWQSYKDISISIWLNPGEQIISVDNLKLTWNFDKLEIKYLNDKQEFTNIVKKAYAYSSSGDANALKDYDKEKIWQADNNENQWAAMRFNREFTVNSVKLYAAKNSEIQSGTLIFSDGTTENFGNISQEGTEIKFENKNITWIRIASLTCNEENKISLAEVEVMGVSTIDSTLGVDTALESFIKIGDNWEKMTNCLKSITIKNGQVEFAWPGFYEINSFKFTGLNNIPENKLKGKILFDDSEVPFDVSGENGIYEIKFDLTKTEKLKIEFENLNSDYITDMVQIFGTGTANLNTGDKYEKVFIENRWTGQALAEKNGAVIYTTSSDEEYNTIKSMWKIIKIEDKFAIQNLDTLNYMALTDDNDTVETISLDTLDDRALWNLTENSGFYRISNVKYPKRALHLENQAQRPGEVIAGDEPESEGWYSALWNFPVATIPSEHYYEITSNKIGGTAGVATSYVSDSITSNVGGSYKTWNLTKDISAYPSFSAKNNTITEAVYNLTMEETLLNIHQGKYGDVFWTGANWGGVWTRDVAMSIQYSLAWQFAQEAKNSIKEKVISNKENPGKDVIEQDTGTGGSYPCSVDKIIMALATWEQYLASGDEEFLSYMYNLMENTIEQDFHVIYDKELKLFNGETGGLDHRSKTYPDWMDERYEDSIVNIAGSKSSIVNIIYVEAMNVLSKSAKILDKGEDREKYWKNQSEELKATVNEKFWLEDRGMYASFIYPNFMGSPVADKVDVISNGYALMYDIANEEQQKSIMENYPLVTYGAPTVWPQKSGLQGGTVYHNKGVWPGWEATLMIGAKEKGNLQLADEIWRSSIRNAAVSLTNKEVVDYATGEGTYSDRQLWSVAATMAGYYRILFGMEYKEDGIHFSPYVPEWLEGPFELNNYKYRDSVINFKLTGKGDTLKSIKVDGVEKSLDYVYSTTMTGTHTIEMVVEDSGNKSKINLAQNGWDICPEMPVMTLEGNLLKWNKDNRFTYKLWNGTEYIDVTGLDSYEIDTTKYGAYSLVATDVRGIDSELSKPVMVNSSENIFKIEAEDGKYSPKKFADKIEGFSGTGYVVDKISTTSAVEIEVEVDKAGEYLLRSRYNNQGDASGTTFCAIRSIYVDNVDFGTMIFPLSNHSFDYSSYVRVYLTKGKHTIKVFYDKDNWYDRNMNITRNDVSYDYFELQYRTETQTPNIAELEKIYKLAKENQENGTVDKLINSAKDEFNNITEQARKALMSNLIFTSQQEIDTATSALTKAFDLLEFESADKTQLQQLIETAEEIAKSLDKYLLNGQNEFLTALKEAKEIFDLELLKGDEKIEKACKNLSDSISKLALKPDKSALEEQINKVYDIDLNQYTNESSAVLQTSLENARAVFENEQATEQEVSDAINNILKAIDNLEKIKNPVSDESSNDSNTSTDENSSDENGSLNTTSDEKTDVEIPNTGSDKINTLLMLFGACACIFVTLIVKKKKNI